MPCEHIYDARLMVEDPMHGQLSHAALISELQGRSCIVIDQRQKNCRKSEGSLGETFLPVHVRRLVMNNSILLNSLSQSDYGTREHTTDGGKIEILVQTPYPIPGIVQGWLGQSWRNLV